MSDKISLKILICVSSVIFISFSVFIVVPITSFNPDYSTVILDRHKELLSASIAADGQWRFPPNDMIPEKYEAALLTYEDRRFYYHFGIDPFAIGRAILSNLKAGEVVSGASTITMQVVRLSRFGKPRTFPEKILEAFLAIQIELQLSKKEILSLYASHAPFGGNVVGLEAASWRYFGYEPEKLTWAESAMLAVLPNSPALIHPGRERRKLLNKRNALLKKMYFKGMFDSLTCQLSMAENLPPAPQSMPMYAPHLLERIKNETDIRNISRLTTTVDKSTQLKVNQIIERYYHKNRENNVHNAAAMVIDVHSGNTLVYVGNVMNRSNDDHGNYVDIITAPRSTGSILKPFLYGGMLQSGEILPGQLVPDIPTRLGGFAPQNYSRRYQGAVPAWQALARSLNIPAVRMLKDFGVDRFYHLLQRLGISTLFRKADDYGLSLILGGAEGTLWDLTSVYARMAFELQTGTGVEKPDWFQVKYLKNKMNHKSVEIDKFPFDAGTIWLVFEAMVEVARPGRENTWRQYTSSQKIAWKTGTSYGHRDAWAIGVTPDYAVGVWVGNADGEGRPGLTGLQMAAPILFDIFNVLEKNNWFSLPEMDLVEVDVCTKSGFRKGINCAQYTTVFSTRNDNTKVCPYCKIIHLDILGQWQVTTNCERLENMINSTWFVLPPAMEKYYLQQHSDYRLLPPFKKGCFEEINLPLALIYPQKDSRIFVPIELDGKRGRTIFQATHREPNMKLYWHLDREFVGETEHIHQIAVAPTPGRHILTVVDEDGNYLERQFTITGRR
jgi:penicillin-binding protein 1C